MIKVTPAASLLSSTGSSLRGLDPANGLAIKCEPDLETSSSGLAPIKVLDSKSESFKEGFSEIFLGRFTAKV